MNSTQEFLPDSFKEKTIENTCHFIFFITDIGVVAVFKDAKIMKSIIQVLNERQIKYLWTELKRKKNIFKLMKKIFSFSTLSVTKIIPVNMMARVYMRYI